MPDLIQKMFLILELTPHSVDLSQTVNPVSVTIVGVFLQVGYLFEEVNVSAVHFSIFCRVLSGG